METAIKTAALTKAQRVLLEELANSHVVQFGCGCDVLDANHRYVRTTSWTTVRLLSQRGFLISEKVGVATTHFTISSAGLKAIAPTAKTLYQFCAGWDLQPMVLRVAALQAFVPDSMENHMQFAGMEWSDLPLSVREGFKQRWM